MSPHSFTGEDVLEISCHGGETVPNNIIQAALDFGLRMAEPGEFSFRSFINGKMDLMQAEAVSTLISSRGSLSSGISLDHLEGKTSVILRGLKTNVLDLLSIIENEFKEEMVKFKQPEVETYLSKFSALLLIIGKFL